MNVPESLQWSGFLLDVSDIISMLEQSTVAAKRVMVHCWRWCTAPVAMGLAIETCALLHGALSFCLWTCHIGRMLFCGVAMVLCRHSGVRRGPQVMA